MIESYTLEVSSPGLDRTLKTKTDFERVKWEMVKVKTYVTVNDEREHVGRVIDCDNEQVLIKLKDTGLSRRIPLDKISGAQIEIEF